MYGKYHIHGFRAPSFWGVCGQFLGAVSFCLIGNSPVLAEVVSGRIQTAQEALVQSAQALGGHVRTRVAAPAEPRSLGSSKLAVFLAVKESLPIEAHDPPEVVFTGLNLAPSVAACAVDDTVTFRNADRENITLVVAGKVLSSLAPGESIVYECTAGTSGDELRNIRVKEWPLVRGTIYVGEVGTAASVDQDGMFSVPAPRGQYTLRVVGLDRVLHVTDVTVEGQKVDMGVIELSPPTEK